MTTNSVSGRAWTQMLRPMPQVRYYYENGTFLGWPCPPLFLDTASSGPLAQLVEQLTFNQWVAGSNPARLTTNIKGLAEITLSLLFLGLHWGYILFFGSVIDRQLVWSRDALYITSNFSDKFNGDYQYLFHTSYFAQSLQDVLSIIVWAKSLPSIEQ